VPEKEVFTELGKENKFPERKEGLARIL